MPSQQGQQDPYCYAGTAVLTNKLGLRDPHQLQQAETAASVLRDTDLRVNVLPGSYDLAHLQAFHKRLFSDIYPWAGRIRTVDISKGTRFAHHAHVETYLGGVLVELSTEKLLMGLNLTGFVERLTYYLAEVNAVHPFREGNGRTQRAFFRQLGAAAGYRITWDDMDPAENIAASAQSLHGDNSALREMLTRITEKV